VRATLCGSTTVVDSSGSITFSNAKIQDGASGPDKIQMALLQISEPGMAPAPHQRRLAVGIDLGTTNSLVAAVRSGVPGLTKLEPGRCRPITSISS